MISAVVLAAGASRRFGGTKQLLEVAGKPLVQHTVDAAHTAGVQDIVVVVGHSSHEVAAALALPASARIVTNVGFAEGQSSSLRAGLRAMHPSSVAAVVLLGDQPGIEPGTIRLLVQAFEATDAPIARLRFRDAPGPAILGRAVWPHALRLEGDSGARSFIERHPAWVHDVPVHAEAPLDVDTPEDAARLGAGEAAP
jgi:molybdenum cofactor cytidylyltransferase